MVGGKNDYALQVNLATGQGGGGRQAGSTFKPFLLAETVKEGYTVESAFPGPPKIVLPHADNGQDWTVKNFEDEDYGTDVNLIDATRNSVNTVYAQLVVAIGADKLKTMAEQMGVKSPLPAVNSLVLGTAEVSPFEMASAFSTFGNRGERVEPRTILEVKASDGKPIRKFAENPHSRHRQANRSAVVDFCLRQVVERGSGTGASFSKVGSLVGKTGTTNDFGDAWFVGATRKLTAAVWMGYPEGPSHQMTDVRGTKVNGGSFPATIFKRFMSKATANLTLGSFPDVTDFPGQVLKGDRIKFDTSSTTTPGSPSSTRTTVPPTTAPGGPTVKRGAHLDSTASRPHPRPRRTAGDHDDGASAKGWRRRLVFAASWGYSERHEKHHSSVVRQRRRRAGRVPRLGHHVDPAHGHQVVVLPGAVLADPLHRREATLAATAGSRRALDGKGGQRWRRR